MFIFNWGFFSSTLFCFFKLTQYTGGGAEGGWGVVSEPFTVLAQQLSAWVIRSSHNYEHRRKSLKTIKNKSLKTIKNIIHSRNSQVSNLSVKAFVIKW